ncbi:MAG: FHA domain-containing protein, partial [Planctomycetes bacterium]|nr:FHA domain-containing protein [Planctomycetota bacterium]
MPAQLVVISGPDKGRSFEIPENQKLVVGRGEGSATKLRDPTVSRTHCQVEIESSQYRLTNLGTASSTLVNGR